MKRIIIILSILIIFVGSLSAIGPNLKEKEQEQDLLSPSIAIIPPPIEMENEINPDEYIVGVGDLFLVEMLIEQSSMIIPVLPSGDILIAGKKSFNFKDKTLTEAYEMVAKEDGPYMRISLYDVKNIRIPVVGAVEKPGVYSVNATWRISDILKLVPLKYLSKEFEIEIRSDKDTTTINIYEFNLNGDKKHNPYLHAGETIFIPFADPETECVEVYGPVMTKSLTPFIKGETLGEFYRRIIVLSDIMDYEKIVVYRNDMQIIISVNEMNSFVLQARDRIEFMILKKIMISGHINRPGTYDFVPGHTVTDYIAMAGGANYKGSSKSSIVIRDNKKFKNPEGMEIKRGDIILVRRSAEDVLIGEISILSFVSLLASIASTVITAFIAAGSL